MALHGLAQLDRAPGWVGARARVRESVKFRVRVRGRGRATATAHQYDSKRWVVTAIRTVAVSSMYRGMFSTLSWLSRSRKGLYLVGVRARVRLRVRVGLAP